MTFLNSALLRTRRRVRPQEEGFEVHLSVSRSRRTPCSTVLAESSVVGFCRALAVHPLVLHRMLPAALFVSAITQSSDTCHSGKNEVCGKIEGTACRRGSMPKLQPVRILVVDDYEPWRQWVSSLLSQQEHLQLVAEVSDGLEAVQKIVLLKPDLILLDINLPI
jgi:PleD family two-component response regulator